MFCCCKFILILVWPFLGLIVVDGSAWQMRASGWVASLSSRKASLWSSSAFHGCLSRCIFSQQGDLIISWICTSVSSKWLHLDVYLNVLLLEIYSHPGFFHSLFMMKSILLLVSFVWCLVIQIFVFSSYFLYWLLVYHLIWCNLQFIFLVFTCEYTIRERESTLQLFALNLWRYSSS